MIDSLVPQIVPTAYPEKSITPQDWAKDFLTGLNNFLVDIEQYPDIFRFYVYSKLTPGKYSERFKFHEDRFFSKRAVPFIRKAFGVGQEEARSMAELINSLRVGIALDWLTETNRTSKGRSKILKTIKLKILDNYQK